VALVVLQRDLPHFSDSKPATAFVSYRKVGRSHVFVSEAGRSGSARPADEANGCGSTVR
jgi:hypothetical protein